MTRTAYDVTEARLHLRDFADDELRRVPVLTAGDRLVAGETYVDLQDPERPQVAGAAGAVAGAAQLLVPRGGVDAAVWKRLTGTPAAGQTGG